MDSKEALMVLDQATQTLNVNRVTHQKIIEALQVLDRALNSKGADNAKRD
jgi:hypothetical protein